MKSLNISLNSLDKIKNFVGIVSNLDSEIDLISGRYVVNAKSIMAVLSLDLSKDIQMNIYNEKIFDDAKKILQDFLI